MLHVEFADIPPGVVYKALEPREEDYDSDVCRIETGVSLSALLPMLKKYGYRLYRLGGLDALFLHARDEDLRARLASHLLGLYKH